MPEWYQKLLAFLGANHINVNNEVGTLFLMGGRDGGLSPLYDFLRPEEAGAKTGWDRMSGLMNGTKALDKLTENDIAAVETLITGNSLYCVNNAAPYTKVRPVMLRDDGTFGFGPEEDAKDRIDGDYRWLIKEHHISETFRGEELSRPYITRQYEIEGADTAEAYGLPAYVKNFFVNYDIDPASVKELPFLRNAADEEEKKRLLRDYFTELMKAPESYLTEDERKVLDDEEIDVKDIRALAYNQGISVKTYMNRLRGIEEIPDPGYGDEGLLSSKNRKSENEILDEAIENINRDLRNAAKNPVEKALTETVIALKENSFNANKNGREMERLFAKLISLKAAQDYLGLKPGEEIAEGDPRRAKIDRVLAAESANTEKIYRDDVFRYFVRKLGPDGLTALSRGADSKPLNDVYTEFCRAQKNKILSDPIKTLDYTLMKCDFINSKRMFFPDKINAGDKWLVPPQNPFGLSYDRTSIVTFAFGRMVEKGFTPADILDENKLAAEKIRTGKEAYSRYQINTPENARQMIDTYLTAYEKCIEFANEQFKRVDSVHPAVISKMKNGEAFFAVATYLKDAFQELGTLQKKVDFTPEQEAKYSKLSNEGELIAYLFSASHQAGKSAAALASGEDVNATSAFQNFCTLECADDIFRRTKKEAKKTGMTVSAYLAAQYEKTKGSPDADATKLVSSSSIAAMAIMKAGVNNIRNNVDKSRKYQQKTAKDFMDGTFRRAAALKLSGGLNAETNLADYFSKFRKAPAAENGAALVQ